MTASIPASAIVNVFPNVLEAGGTGLELTGLFLTRNPRVPLGTVADFSSPATVGDYFGAGSPEAIFAAVYFAGFAGSQIKPAKLSLASHPDAATGAFLRGGRVSGLTIPQLQALNGVLTLTVDGRPVVSAAIDLVSAGSFSAAATLIETGLDDFAAVFDGSIATDVLTVATVASGEIAVGQIIQGTGISVGTVITGFLTGTGGAGTYNVDVPQTAASTTISSGKTLVVFDSVAGAFVVSSGTPGAGGLITYAAGTLSTGVALTAATGAILSPGGSLLSPGAIMGAVSAFTQDFVSFGTIYEPVIDDKVAFAAWASGVGNRFLYLMTDSTPGATVPGSTTNASALIHAAEYSGVMALYAPTNPAALAAFVSGSIASIDFDQVDGRTNLAFRRQDGLLAGVTDQTVGDNLIANGYSFYGAYATANGRFVFLYPGSVSGPFLWADSFINQVWLSNNFQLQLLQLLLNVRSIPYNEAGSARIEQSLAGPIDAALAFGAIRAGVSLTATQSVAINAEAGGLVADTVAQRGWYLKVGEASPAVRAARGSPPIAFWYTDGQSVQKISLNSIQVQ